MVAAPTSFGPSVRRPGPSLRASLITLIGGVVIAVVAGVIGALPIWRTFTAPVLDTPVDRTMHLDRGRYALFERTGTRTGFAAATVSFDGSTRIGAADVRVVGPDGKPLTVRPARSTETVNRDSSIFTDAVEFTVLKAGDYHLRVDGVDAGQVVVGRELGDVVTERIGWFALSGLGMLLTLLGIILLIVGAVRRSRADKQAALGYGGYGVGYSAYGGYGAYAAGTPTPTGAPTVTTLGSPTGAPTATPVGAPTMAPAGWYPDPYDPTRQRYWDGTSWTTYTA